MNLAHPDWLPKLIEQFGLAPEVPVPADAFVRVRAARVHLESRLAGLGLLYGTPLIPTDLPPEAPAAERLFLALMAGLARLGGEVAAQLGRPVAQRSTDVAAPFLALAGFEDDAIAAARGRLSARALRRALVRAAENLRERAGTLTGDPVYGVPLHNGLTYVDAWLFGRLAIATLACREPTPSRLRRRLQQGSQDTAVLVEVLVQLAWADGPPSEFARRAIRRQIASLGLPRSVAVVLRARLEEPGRPEELAARIRRRDHRRFVFAQAVLASLVDGRRSVKEKAFLRRLAKALDFSDADVQARELELAAFYAEHREVVDTFTAGQAGRELADEVVDRLAVQVERNLTAVVQEVRQTGELAELLAKAARGHALSVEDKVALRRDLLDVARAVPSLALAAAPGGFLLLAALAKVLPFQILPSAWVKRVEGPPSP